MSTIPLTRTTLETMPSKAPNAASAAILENERYSKQAETVAEKSAQRHEGEAGTLIDHDVPIRPDVDHEAFHRVRQVRHNGEQLYRLEGEHPEWRLEHIA